MTNSRRPSRPVRPRLEVSARSRVFATIPLGTDGDPRMQVILAQTFDKESVMLTHGDIARVYKYLGRVLEYNAQFKRKLKGVGK